MNEQAYSALLERVKQEAMSHSNGKQTSGWLHVECPLDHKRDKHNHAFLHPSGAFLKCHGKHGIIRLGQLCELWGIPYSGERSTYTPPVSQTPKAKPPVLYDVAWEGQLPPHAYDYLASRGLPPSAVAFYHLGWTGRDSRLEPWAHERLTIPWRINGKILGVKLKKIGKSGYLSLPNSDFSTFFNYNCGATRVVLETELDACALGWAIGKPLIGLATPAGSLNAYKMALLVGVRLLLINGDADEAGQKMLATAQSLRKNVLGVKPLAGCKDLGEGLPELPDWAIRLAV